MWISLTTTTSSAILTQENSTFVPYSVEICHRIRYVIFYRFRLRLSQRFRTCWYRQGSDDLYRRVTLWKGHLATSLTFPNDQNCYVSTFTYTNAVPQCLAFNSGRWKAVEKRIRNYSFEDCTKGLHCVNLVFLNRHLFYSHWTRQVSKAIHLLRRFLEDYPFITIPNSMRTAGCCVFPHYKHHNTDILLWLKVMSRI